MRILYHYPKGYSSDITHAKEINDLNGWVNRKFGDRIRLLISDDFAIDVQDDHFVVDFTYQDDSDAFLALIGGKEID